MSENPTPSSKAIVFQKCYPLIFALCYCATFISLFETIRNAYKGGDYIVSSGYIIFFIIVLFGGWVLRPSPPCKKIPNKNIFQGVSELNQENAWHRSEEQELCDDIELAEKPIILVGPSGAGKSVLLKTKVKPYFEKPPHSWKCSKFSDYNDFDIIKSNILTTLRKVFPNFVDKEFLPDGIVNGIDGDKNLLLIFDQFEQFLLTSSEPVVENRSPTRGDWFKNVVESSRKFSNLKFVIVVRKDYYYDLRFLRGIVPAPTYAFHLSGFKVTESEAARTEIRSNLKKINLSDDTAHVVFESLIKDNEILPIEAQMAGLMLENMHDPEAENITPEFYLKTLGGKEGLIRRYFKDYLDSSSNPYITSKVLFALSTKTVLRHNLSPSKIADIVHESNTDVVKCLLFLTKCGFVHKAKEQERYEIAHDYLAEKFNDFSGTELDPVDKDNIVFLRDKMRISKELLNNIITRRAHLGTKLVFGDYFMIGVCILLLIRLFAPMYNLDWGWFNPLNKYYPHSALGIDIYFLPVFISHFAWTLYVTLFYRNFLLHLKKNEKGSYGRFVSQAIVVICTLCVITAVFVPHFYLCSIAIGGLPVGMKLYGFSRNKGYCKVSSEFFKKNGGKTFINMSITMCAGMALFLYVRSIPSLEPTEIVDAVNKFNMVSLIVAVVMVYAMLCCRDEQATRSASSQMLGLIDRAKVTKVIVEHYKCNQFGVKDA